MNAFINATNRVRLGRIRRELFNMANSYAGDEHGHVACRLHGISNSVYNISDIMEVLYPLDGTPAESRYGRQLGAVKPLAQYLMEYIEHETGMDCHYGTWRDLLQQALDAYELTENVTIKIERK